MFKYLEHLKRRLLLQGEKRYTS